MTPRQKLRRMVIAYRLWLGWRGRYRRDSFRGKLIAEVKTAIRSGRKLDEPFAQMVLTLHPVRETR